MRVDKYALDNTARMEKRFGSSARDGLPLDEVAKRQKVLGKNQILPRNNNLIFSFLGEIIRKGTLPLMILSLVIFLVVSPASAAFCGCLSLLYLIALFFLFSYRARERRALEKTLLPSVKVVRGGKRVTVSPEDLVPGDLLLLKAGDVLYCYAHLISEEPIEVSCSRDKRIKILQKYGGACFDTTEESHNFLAAGDRINKGEATAFVTEYADRDGEGDLPADTVSAQNSIGRVASRVGILLVMLLLLAAFFYAKKHGDASFFYDALGVSAILLAISPVSFISLFCDVIFFAENRHLLRTDRSFLTGLRTAEKLCEVDSFVLSTRSVYRTARVNVRYFEMASGKRFLHNTPGTVSELSLVCAAVREIHGKQATGPIEKNLLSYCKKHLGRADKLCLQSPPTRKDEFSLASFVNQTTGRAFSLLTGDAEQLIESATYVSEEGRTRLLDAKTKSAMLAAVRKNKADGFLMLAYAETQVRALDNVFPSSFPDLKLLGTFVLSEVPDAKISGTLRRLEEEGKKVFLIHDGDDPSWIMREIGSLSHASVIDGGSPSFRDEIQIFTVDPDISFCIGVRLTAAQKAYLVSALKEAGHRVAVTGGRLSDHQMMSHAYVGFVPLVDGKISAPPVVRATDAIYAKENVFYQINCAKKATSLLGAFGLIASYLCASFVIRVAVAALGYFFGVSLLSAFWYACLGGLLDLFAVWMLSRSRTSETHHIADTLEQTKRKSGSFFFGALSGAVVTGCLAVWMAMAPERFDFGANAFLFLSLLLLLNVGLWRFARTKGQTGILKFSALSVLLAAVFFLLGLFSGGAYGAIFAPAILFWALIPTTVMVAIGKGALYKSQRKNINIKGV